MTPQAKSSRKRTDARVKGFVKSSPAIYYRLHPKTQEEMQCLNRPMRRWHAAERRKNSKRYADQS